MSLTELSCLRCCICICSCFCYRWFYSCCLFYTLHILGISLVYVYLFSLFVYDGILGRFSYLFIHSFGMGMMFVVVRHWL